MIEFVVDEFEIKYMDGFAIKMLDTFSGSITEIRLSTLRDLMRKLDQEIFDNLKEAGDDSK